MNAVVWLCDRIYAVVMHGASMGLPLASRFHAKLRRRVAAEGELRRQIAYTTESSAAPRIWMHAASMGELEQLVPIIHRLRARRADVTVTMTCTSPSGVEHVLRLGSLVDSVAYLAVDTRRNAEHWLEQIKPDLVIFDRYDLWRNHVVAAHKRSIPVWLVNATASSQSIRFLVPWLSDTYRRCARITAVTNDDARQLQRLSGNDVDVLPDTRADRVVDRVQAIGKQESGSSQTSIPTLVIGSSWRQDESIIIAAVQQAEWKGRCIIVPHEPTEDVLQSIEARIACTRWSVAEPSTAGHLVVDSVGALLSIYARADAAWIGGGFGSGVHSLAEPAAYGIPLACGPRIDRARDAKPLIDVGALSICSTTEDAVSWLRSVVAIPLERQRQGTAAKTYIQAGTGSSDIIADRIVTFLEG